jgi:DNA-binding transcriptional MerR regulator
MASAFRLSAEATFNTREVCQIARVTPRQLQWWAERGIVRPNREKRRREYRTGDVIAILVTAELRRKGLSLQKSRRVIRWFRAEMDRSRSMPPARPAEWFLLTNGKTTYLESQKDDIVALLKQARQPLLLVSISDQMARLDEFTSKAREPQRGHGGSKMRRRADDQLTLFS